MRRRSALRFAGAALLRVNFETHHMENNLGFSAARGDIPGVHSASLWHVLSASGVKYTINKESVAALNMATYSAATAQKMK